MSYVHAGTSAGRPRSPHATWNRHSDNSAAASAASLHPSAKVPVCEQSQKAKHLPSPSPAPTQPARAAIPRAHPAAPRSCSAWEHQHPPHGGCLPRTEEQLRGCPPAPREWRCPFSAAAAPGACGASGQGEAVVQTTCSTPCRLLASALAPVPGRLPWDPWLPGCLGHTQSSWPVASHRQPPHQPGPPARPQLPRRAALGAERSAEPGMPTSPLGSPDSQPCKGKIPPQAAAGQWVAMPSPTPGAAVGLGRGRRAARAPSPLPTRHAGSRAALPEGIGMPRSGAGGSGRSHAALHAKAAGSGRCRQAPCGAGSARSAPAVRHTCLVLPAQGLLPVAEIEEESAALRFLQQRRRRAPRARGPARGRPSSSRRAERGTSRDAVRPPRRAEPLRKASVTQTPPDDRQEGLESLIGCFQLCHAQRMTKREDVGNDKDPIKKNSHVDLRKIKIQD